MGISRLPTSTQAIMAALDGAGRGQTMDFAGGFFRSSRKSIFEIFGNDDRANREALRAAQAACGR
jgi:hypothetical protein